MGLEILEDLPDVDVIIAPFGGGGHICGIAAAVKAKKPDVKVSQKFKPLYLCFDNKLR